MAAVRDRGSGNTGRPRWEHRHLPFKAEDAAVDVGLAEEDAGIVDQIARREVVGAVDNQVIRREQAQCVGRGQRLVAEIDLHVGIGSLYALSGDFDLALAPDHR